ncbi:Ig-like domain-containing protein [Luteimicrobium xylanilyticum]|uniref:Chitinase n=1 Tax=Luteimicrobium xylanilyticum TaxID=1133546 RepID=A0A5P9Q741_9MICO|nr:Chitinase [Luteimicrobium xylanilyticum]
MGLLQSLNARRKTVASVSTVSVVSTAMVALALTYHGEPTAKVELNDSGVWVTRGTGAELGRFNTAAQALDTTLVSSGTAADVLQEAETVLAFDPGLGTLSPVDVADSKLRGTAKLPADAQVGLGGAATAILDPDKGRLWVVPAVGVTSFDQDVTEPVTTVKKGAVLAVGQDGTVHVADPTGTLTTVTTTDEGTADRTTRAKLKGVSAGDALGITAVGRDAVVLDATTSTLHLPGGTAKVDGTDPVLQQVSAAAATVAYATTSGLVTQPLSGSKATRHAAEGRPAAPVQVGGCTYGAWSGSGQVLRDCDGKTRDLDQHLAGLDSAATLRYRVNRSNVVLNDLASGTVWLAADEFQKVDDWEQKLPENAKGEESDAESDTPEQVDQPIKNRSDENRPPRPKDDTFGVRPGRATVLPVLANDYDPDGDVMAADVDGDGPSNAAVSQVMGGDALLATTEDDASGSSTFRYRVTDGRPGGSATASVHLTVVPYSAPDRDPKQTGEPVLTLVRGGTGSIKVLPYFLDPDGDDVYLADAAAKTKGDEVRFQPDGTVEYRDAGATTGRKAVTLTVGDGLGGTVQGTLWVDVKGAGNQPPIAVGDHATTQPGQPVTLSLLRNDSDPNGDELRLASAPPIDGAKVTKNLEAGTVEVVADRPGSYVGTYQVSDGPTATTGVYRVDVVDPDASSGPPVAVPDTALLPSGGQTLVDVLGNDSDPAGGVLVVQSVEVPDDAGITVAVLGHSVLRVTESRHLTEPVTLTYTISNGTDSATGQVRVVSVPAPNKLHPPHAVADVATVHTHDVVTIPVLANDTHPDGLALTLQSELADLPDPSLGRAFVSGGQVRFQSTGKAGTAYLIYRVRDKNGQEDSAQVTIHVDGDAENSPPKAPTVVARTVSGGSVTITPKLDGVDPDGDSVRLTGIGSPASQGTAKVTAGTIVYTAAAHATGTDVFEYTVEDRRGQSASGTVRVGIAPPATTNQPPVAVDDTVTVRPGRAVSVAPLTNDSDPDGDRISLVSSLQTQDGLKATTDGNLVGFTAPQKQGTTTIFYTVEDARGARATGAVVVTVSAKAPLKPPVAKDDVVSGADVVGQRSVAVPVLANDSDPDGAASALTVTTAQRGVTVRKDGTLSVPLTREAQVFAYTVTDPDGLTDQAFVWVPALQVDEPTLRPDAKPLTVETGKPLTIDIRQQVQVADGRTARLTEDNAVKAVNGSRDVVDTHTIRFVSDDGFTGRASVTFEVTDGDGPGDPDGNVATLTVPITVKAPANTAPRFTGSPAVRVGAGDADGADLDLTSFVTDADDDPLSFAAVSVPAGLKVTVAESGATHVVAAPETPKGRLTARVSVTDGVDGHKPVTADVHVTVGASTRHKPVATEDVIDRAAAGKELSIPVLANDVNPFADEGKALTLTAVALDSGDASRPVIRGDRVVVTPDKDFHGQIVLRYTVGDATKDPDRQVDGQVLITVQGHPDAPAKPEIGTIESHQVTLSWTPPNNNGADITSYTVTPSSGAPQQCATTTCTIKGLTNDTEYTFTVVANNEVGPSEPSPESDQARPDERPDQPAAPTLEFGDGELTVTWKNKAYTDRSAIESVNLQISPAAPDGTTQKQGVTGTTVVWKGLDNGTAYTVQVQAVNRADAPSDWSAASAPEVPAGKPSAPAKPDVTRTSIGTTSQMRVTWTPPNDNGGDITGYDVQVLRGGKTVKTVKAGGSATAATVDVAANTSDYTFKVRARNKATDKFGAAPWSPSSDEVRAFAKPGEVGSLKASPTGVNKQVKLTWSRASGAGLRANEIMYQYSACGGGWTNISNGATSATVTCGSNGTKYTYKVRAVPNVDGLDEADAGGAASTTATPYGRVPTPSVSVSKSGSAGNETLTFTVKGTTNGLKTTVKVTGDKSTSFSVSQASGSGTKTYKFTGLGYSKTRQICATSTDGHTTSSKVCKSKTTDKKPEPVLKVSKGPKHKLPDNTGMPGTCQADACALLHLKITGAAANKSFTVTCYGGGSKIGMGGYTHDFDDKTLKTNGSGNYEGDQMCVFGYSGESVYIQASPLGTTNKLTW